MLKTAERFFKAYSGIPLEERKIPILIINDKPINWNLAHEEISNETGRGKEILKIMIELETI